MPQFGQTKKPLLCKRFRPQDLRSDAPSAAGTALRCKRFQAEASEILPEKEQLRRGDGNHTICAPICATTVQRTCALFSPTLAPSVRSSEHLLTRPHVSTVVVLHPPETEQADHRDQPAQLFFCVFFG